MTLASGARLGPYEITSPLGAELPTWTPSGDRILFARVKSFRSTLGAVDPSSAEIRSIGPPGGGIRAVVEPDGRHMVYATDEGGGRLSLWRAPVDSGLRPTGTPVAISRTSLLLSKFCVAPQGDLLAYASVQSEHSDVFLSTRTLAGAGRETASSISRATT